MYKPLHKVLFNAIFYHEGIRIIDLINRSSDVVCLNREKYQLNINRDINSNAVLDIIVISEPKVHIP